MKKAILYTLTVCVLCIGSMPAVHAETGALEPPFILISEIQTASADDATEEFVELYNRRAEPVDITGWHLQYRAASGTAAQAWTAASIKATFACPAESTPDCKVTIPAKGRVVTVHTITDIAGSLSMTGGFSATGGQIRLVQPGTQPIIHDTVGYGTATFSETTPAAAPTPGKSIKRVMNSDDELVDTDNNAADFIAACGDPTPGQHDTTYIPRTNGCETPPIPEPDPITPAENPGGDPEINQPTEQQPGQGGALTYLPVIVTEVFPDPVSPQQDTTDEFIEIYNPNDTAVDLKDYRLQTGNEFRYTYTLGDTPLGPHAYLAIPSAVSKLSLANGGSGVRLIDPNNIIAYEVPTYGDAKPGQSWMQDDTGWKWTLTPTPGVANVATAPQPKIAAASATPTKKKATAIKTTTPKSTAVKQAKAPAAKKTVPDVPKTQASQAASAANPQYWLLLPIGALAASYAAYEYRQGISRGVRTGWAKVRGKEPPRIE